MKSDNPAFSHRIARVLKAVEPIKEKKLSKGAELRLNVLDTINSQLGFKNADLEECLGKLSAYFVNNFKIQVEPKEDKDKNRVNLSHAEFLVEMGIQLDNALLVRMGERVASLVGLRFKPTTTEQVNQFILTNSDKYREASQKVREVNLQSIHNKSTVDSILAVDHMKYKGLEKIADTREMELYNCYFVPETLKI